MLRLATPSFSFVRLYPFDAFQCLTFHPDSGHSDQQEATDDTDEEDNQDESAPFSLPRNTLPDVRLDRDHYKR